MSYADITYEEAKDVIGILPNCEPRPNFTNIRAMWLDLVDKLTTIPSEQSEALGYSGMVQPPEIYALDTGTPWQDWPNPGAHFTVDENWTDTEKENNELVYKANKKVYNNQQNVKRAVVDALNIAVPRYYKRGTGTTRVKSLSDSKGCTDK